MIDLHCHILHGLDDGAGSLEESVAMAKIAQKDGITTIVATPHLFRSNLPADDFVSIGDRRQELRRAIANNSVAVEVKGGAEVHISHNLVNEIRAHRNNLVINGSGYMFIEFPSSHIYPGVNKLIFDLMSEGIIPIIAHPERNSVFARHPGLLYDLVRMGALAQANSGSLNGLYGREPSENILCFLKWNLIHFLASDGHNSTSMPPRLSEAVRSAEAVIGREQARSLVEDNPRAVLNDLEIPFLPSPIDPRKSSRSFSFRIPGFLRRNR
jgi:protein-tyrosine phosphatase